jgi:S-DNA-T family DNA segregation ATPase FtsK/SpoIIIE
MRFSVSDRRAGAGRAAAPQDVSLGPVAEDATVAELLEVLAPAGGLPDLADPDLALELDGWRVSAGERIVDVPLRAGSELVLRTATGPGGAGQPAVPLFRLTQVAGPDCGLSVDLGPGSYLVGPGRRGFAAGRVGRPALRIDVAAGGCRATALDPATVRVDGRTLAAGESAPAQEALVVAGGAAFRLDRAAPGPDQPAARHDLAPEPDAAAETDRYGRRPLIRTPRVTVPAPPADVPVPDPPAPAAAPQPVSWLLMLAPLPIGIVLAVVFSPFFLIMTAMTPLMGLARWLEGKFRARKEAARIAIETAAAAVRFAEDLDATRAAVAAAARAAYPDLGELWRRARTGRDLWQVRPGDPDELRVALGFADLPWRPELGRRADAVRTMPELAGTLAERAGLADVPVLVDLRTCGGLGVVGPGRVARRVAAAAVLDLVTRHGPADLGLVLLVEPARLPAWEWAKWLPHLGGEDGEPQVATDPETAAGLLARLAGVATGTGEGPARASAGGPTRATGAAVRQESRPGAGPPPGPGHTVVVVDGEDLLTGPVASLLGRFARDQGRALVLGSRVARLPSVCRSFVEIAQDGTATLTNATTGERTDRLCTIRAAPATCTGTARALARWTDPEQASPAALLPDRAWLRELLLAAAAGADGLGRPVSALDPATLAAWWRRGVPGLQATLGVTERGPLTVDLLSDGPHGLVVGTTGAGKSELLRTLVASLACRYSPDQLTFLLVDFKGGGAFDACAGLPHTVGLVTDLDEHLAARALQCLRAELRHRERRLREVGVSDLRDYLAPSPPLPRLVIVIDEFATLAVELPGFLSALVDVAQRGRSLGIHLLLATQRPQGVIDGKIRANTNLRVALRVQDDADSRDVLGARQAADIDRRRPGRGYVRLGASEIVAFQTALVSQSATAGVSARIEVAPFQLAPAGPPEPAPVGADPRPVPGVPDPAGPDGRTGSRPNDLAELAVAAAAAAAQAGYEPARVPWPAPLPAELDAWTLPDPPPERPERGPETGAPAPVPVGRVDLPDEQRSDVWWWRPDAGGTLVLGADPAATGTVLASACLSLARHRHPQQQRLFILDGSGYGLGALARLPHVAAAVGADDTERLSRVLDWLDAEVVRRRSGAHEPAAEAGAAGPEILVVVAGWGAVVEGAEHAGLADTAARLERLLRDGGPVRVRLLVSAAHERGVPGRVLAQLTTKLCLRLADPAGYTGLGLRAREVPELDGLRAIDLQTRHELVVGRYGGDGPGALAEAADRIAGQYPDAVPAPVIGVLPERVPAVDVLASSEVSGASWRLGLGRYYRDLTVATLALAPGMHLVVAGPPGSGRTNALRVLAAAARASAPEAIICVVAADPAAWDPAEATELVGAFEQLRRWPPEGRGLLLVDGVEGMGPAAGAALDRLLPSVPAGFHVVVAGRAEAFRGMQPWQRAVTMSRTGVLLRPGPEDGDILRIRLPREPAPRPVPGRGYLVDAGGSAQVQAAFLPAAGVTPAHRHGDLKQRLAVPAAFAGGAR